MSSADAGRTTAREPDVDEPEGTPPYAVGPPVEIRASAAWMSLG
ncbi:hypothetical protein AWB68_08350 [Caballeronia choica]|uniref:Uncharacterized protein n=1 Tax=Caballeronia choica TaxID=326476 RepID=A0A158L2N8_9BURK|nr:hypothetical protein AWB68_08350 [Caballeronia choica]